MNKIYYKGFENGKHILLALMGMPEEPDNEKYANEMQIALAWHEYKAEVEAIKANAPRIVNGIIFDDGDGFIKVVERNGEYEFKCKPGDIFDIPSGYEFKECEYDDSGAYLVIKTGVRIVKTEDKDYTMNTGDGYGTTMGVKTEAQEGWEKHWEEANYQIREGVNPHAYRLGFLKAQKLSKPESEESQTEKIICAAVWFQDGQTTYIHQPKNISSGYVVAGRRHHNCFTLHAMLTGVGQKAESVQGFLTDTDRFVDRKEAMEIAKQSGQVPKSQSFEELYSEDLY